MVSGLARSTLGVMHGMRLHRLFAPSQSGIGAILAFHRVLPEEEEDEFRPQASLTVTPRFLAAAIEFLLDGGYDIVSLAEARRRIVGSGSTRRFCCLTFDDGYRDNYLHALPVARRYGIPITIFVTTGLLTGSRVPWEFGLQHLVRSKSSIELLHRDRRYRFRTRDLAEKEAAYRALSRVFEGIGASEIPFLFAQLAERYGLAFEEALASQMLSWSDLAELATSGLVEIGAHTVRHRILSQLGIAAARAEMALSREVLEAHLGCPVEFLAYPYGQLRHAGVREYALAAELGFAGAVTMRHGTVRPSHRNMLHALPRISMNGTYATLRSLELFLSGTVEALIPEAAR